MKVYFAHPCFNGPQEAFKKNFLEKLQNKLELLEEGADIVIEDPFEYTPNVEGDRDIKLAMSEDIKTACLSLLEECEAVMALSDWEDTGTAFEVGYAHCMKIPVILVSAATSDSANAMLIGAAVERFDNILDDTQTEALALTLRGLHRRKTGRASSHGGSL
jgi:nucleoside 2-deoxyribosyltransferase